MTIITRRDALLRGLAATGVAAFGTVPGWALPKPGPEERLVPFTDVPGGFTLAPDPAVRLLDIRGIDGMLTPADRFFTRQHHGRGQIDPVSFRLKITGRIETPMELSLDDLERRPAVMLSAGYECSRNGPRHVQGLVSNGVWTGVGLAALLGDAGLYPDGREVVFFGADRAQNAFPPGREPPDVEEPYARSLSAAHALAGDAVLAYALNGAPLSEHQGAPLRVIVPGWYGVANVKWLVQIHVQRDPFSGRFTNGARATPMRLKSVIARVTKTQAGHRVFGFALTDGTPLEAVEVRIDGGPWRPATLDPAATAYSWKLFTYDWTGATPGEHTVVSRARDALGRVQPEPGDSTARIRTSDSSGQWPRSVRIEG